MEPINYSLKIEEDEHNLGQAVGDATTIAADIDFDPETSAIYILNNGDINDLLYSIDNGTTWLLLAPGISIERFYRTAKLKLKSSTDTTGYQVEYTQAP